MSDPTSQPVEKLHDLDRPEHLLIWTLRAIAFGQSDCPVLARTYDAACGTSGAEALGLYFLLVRHVTQNARRRIRVHAPGCGCVGADELALVGAVAAAQASLASKDETLLRLRLNSLVSGDASEAAIFAAQAVGQVLHACGHRLPVRVQTPHDAFDRPTLKVVQ